MKIPLVEMQDYITVNNIDINMVESIIKSINKKKEEHESKEPKGTSIHYEKWELIGEELSETLEIFGELHYLLKYNSPAHLKNIQKVLNVSYIGTKLNHWMAEDNWNLDKTKNMINIIEGKIEEFEAARDNSDGQKMIEFENIIKELENIEYELDNFIDFLEDKLSVRLNDCYKQVDYSKSLYRIKMDVDKSTVKIKKTNATEIVTTRTVDFTKTEYEKVPVYVFFGRDYCYYDGHEIENVKALFINLKTNKQEAVNIMYCKNCNKYRISKFSYDNYMNNNIIPKLILKIITKNNIGDLNEKSILTLYGYNARKNGLKERERQKILSFILNRKIAEKVKILDVLRFDIEFIGKNKNRELAVEKWKVDYDFVDNFEIDSQREVFGEIINPKLV